MATNPPNRYPIGTIIRESANTISILSLTRRMSSIRPWLTEPQRPLDRTVNLVEFTLLVLTDLITKFDHHTQDDRWDVMIFILRQISDIQFQLLMQS